jgi:hypothetical protein
VRVRLTGEAYTAETLPAASLTHGYRVTLPVVSVAYEPGAAALHEAEFAAGLLTFSVIR